MPAPTVTMVAPPPLTYPAGVDGIVRPEAVIRWTGGVGPFDVLHEWDTTNTFPAPITDANAGVTSPDTGVPPADMGPAGTDWFYRVRVTDTSDATSTLSAVQTLTWFDQIDARRYLYLLANLGVGFDPIDTPAGGWGPAPANDFPDGRARDFRRYLYLLANLGVGFDPTDTPAGGWGSAGAPGDGLTRDFRRYLYLLGFVTTDTPTPHIWYVFPSFGREGWEFRIVGYGFGDTQGALTGTATLNGLAVGVISWELVAQTSADLTIDPGVDVAEPIHQLIRATVPDGGTSGLVVVCTDGP